LHPGGSPVRRAYTSVGNVVHYTLGILERPVEQMRGQVFYLGEPAMDSLEWVNAFSQRLCGRDVRILPRAVLSGVGRAGDSLNALGLPFPFSTARYSRMTTSDAVPIETTIAALGPPAQPFEEAVDETVDWLGRYGLTRPG
jgi:nucleoside-diphosphate-sugar epimerase